MVGLCDCNNFFVSCQRLFQPHLDGKPVLVLSGNDGCVIARSNEVKSLGIKMGVPLYQVKDIVEKNKVTLFSANHRLYSDISQRVMATLRANTPAIEVYSVDEAFIDFSSFDVETLKARGEALASLVKRNTGIPVSIGIAPTKTLAKIASKLCKQYPKLNGCCLMYHPEDITKVLKRLPIGEVWGIGRRTEQKLRKYGVATAFDFTQQPASWVQSQLHLPGLRTWKELRSEPAVVLTAAAVANQSMSMGRSFQKEMKTVEELEPVVSHFASILASKLRAHGSCVSQITTYLHTNRHRVDQPQHFMADLVKLETPTNSTLEIVQAALDSLKKIFKVGYGYKKAGVICSHLSSQKAVQTSLFDLVDREKHSQLMHAIDTIHSHYGNNSLHLAVESDTNRYYNSSFLSPCYTSKWVDIIEVKDV